MLSRIRGRQSSSRSHGTNAGSNVFYEQCQYQELFFISLQTVIPRLACPSSRTFSSPLWTLFLSKGRLRPAERMIMENRICLASLFALRGNQGREPEDPCPRLNSSPSGPLGNYTPQRGSWRETMEAISAVCHFDPTAASMPYQTEILPSTRKPRSLDASDCRSTILLKPAVDIRSTFVRKQEHSSSTPFSLEPPDSTRHIKLPSPRSVAPVVQTSSQPLLHKP